ncbi:MAG: hypothetical protein US45_C0011G0001, partial [Candidatus Nomurabacteria bacterium GW2011_GWA1_37_20]
MAENIPQNPKKETVKINLPPRPTPDPSLEIRLPEAEKDLIVAEKGRLAMYWDK